MSNPEKRDDRSMSDILASIRKIMAQEPEGALPSPTRSALNGVSGATLDLPRDPELRLPPRNPSPDSPAPAEAVSLDELLAETPRAVPLSPPAAGPAAPPAGLGGRLEARSQPVPAEPAKETSTKDADKDHLPRVAASDEAVPPSAMVPPAADPANAPKAPTLDAAPDSAPSAVITAPPMPKLGDLGSVVPGSRGGDGPPQLVETGAMRPSSSERLVIDPAIATPPPGDAMRTPASRAAMPEVPGADALRRLIAGVIPPSAHPSVAPTAKAPETTHSAPEPAPAPPAAPPRFMPRAPEPEKSDTASKPTLETKPEAQPETKPEAKIEPKAPLPQPQVPTMPEAPAPAPAPSIAVTPEPVPTVKPVFPTSVPTWAAKLEAQTPAPSAAPASPPSGQSSGPTTSKSMDETVVELLRPLLRDWLNTNMPRLIEPALKAELEALRSAAAKDKTD